LRGPKRTAATIADPVHTPTVRPQYIDGDLEAMRQGVLAPEPGKAYPSEILADLAEIEPHWPVIPERGFLRLRCTLQGGKRAWSVQRHHRVHQGRLERIQRVLDTINQNAGAVPA
jgi:hypothetical protein